MFPDEERAQDQLRANLAQAAEVQLHAGDYAAAFASLKTSLELPEAKPSEAHLRAAELLAQ